MAKHNGPLCVKGSEGKVHAIFREYNELDDLELHTFASAEAQIAAIADDIAYNNHDIADGLRANLFTWDDMLHLPFVEQMVKEVYDLYGDLEEGRRAAKYSMHIFTFLQLNHGISCGLHRNIITYCLCKIR